VSSRLCCSRICIHLWLKRSCSPFGFQSSVFWTYPRPSAFIRG
jgi:hypothetical protein